MIDKILKIPIIALALESRDWARYAYEDSELKYRRKQIYKSVFGALTSPIFARKWFNQLKSNYLSFVIPYRRQLYLKPFRVYLDITWSKKQKSKVILDSYKFILSRKESFKKVVTEEKGIELASFKLNNEIEAQILLGHDFRYRKEGEFALTLNCEELGGNIVTAAFSVEEILNKKWIVRLGCVQGGVVNDENNNNVKTVQKLLHGMRPKSLIVFAVQEFARNLEFEGIYGVGDSIHTYRRKHLIHLPWFHTISFDYDSLWKESGAEIQKDGWFKLPLIPQKKEIQDIKSNKRSQYARRYKLLDEIGAEIKKNLELY